MTNATKKTIRRQIGTGRDRTKKQLQRIGNPPFRKTDKSRKKVGKECQDQRKMITRSVHKQTKASMCRRLKKSQHRREVVKSFLRLALSGFLETRKS